MTDIPLGEFLEHYQVKQIKGICRKLRRRSTPSEDLLWQALRNRRLDGLKFLRQHPFGPSIVDFYCHEKRLVIEVDGGIHLNKDIQEYDKSRQEFIELYGVKFFRCTTEQVERDLEGVLVGILMAAGKASVPTK
ncbi:MAG: endonuclease domain-containing protein [Candidatus Neomarinimicrobiota bacterium]